MRVVEEFEAIECGSESEEKEKSGDGHSSRGKRKRMKGEDKIERMAVPISNKIIELDTFTNINPSILSTLI